jgi:ribosomal 50S subunit-recycling heat shock protein
VPPEASLGPRFTVERLAGALPAISWRWDPETDILSGTFRSSGSSRLDGTIELTDAEGAIAVLDVADGAVAGLDVVVWPEVTSSRSLALPSVVESGRVVLRGPRADRTTSVEIEAVLTIRTNPGESLYHLKLGGLPAARAVRVADQLLVELDAEDGLVGCWLLGVPPFPSLDD